MESSGQPRWLDASERQTWFALISLLIKLPSALDSQLRRDAGVSHFEYQVLAGLSEATEGALRMSELAVFAEGSLPRLSQVVSRLERRGWVRRAPDLSDGRCTLAMLTAEGRAKVAETAPGHVAAVRRLVFDPLTKSQQRQLTEIGRRIVGAIETAESCPASAAADGPQRGTNRARQEVPS